MSIISVRSGRLCREILDYHILVHWFLDMQLDEPAFDHSTFSANRDRLLEHQVAPQFFDDSGPRRPQGGAPVDEHFTVDGTLIEAWASLKRGQPKEPTAPASAPHENPSNPSVDFHGEKRSNATHQSTTDPETRLARTGKGKEATMSFSGYVLMENRHGLCVDLRVEPATGTAERKAASAHAGPPRPAMGPVPHPRGGYGLSHP